MAELDVIIEAVMTNTAQVTNKNSTITRINKTLVFKTPKGKTTPKKGSQMNEQFHVVLLSCGINSGPTQRACQEAWKTFMMVHQAEVTHIISVVHWHIHILRVHTFIHTYMYYGYIHTPIHTYLHTCTQTYMHTYTHKHA